MKRRFEFMRVCVIGAVLGAAGLLSTGAQAQTALAADPTPYWWFHGTVEVGGRVFLNNPQRGNQTVTGAATGCGVAATSPCPGVAGQSLAGYYEYSDNKPGAFGNIDMAAGSKDGLYQFNILGKNIGYNDQSYNFDFSKAGSHYLGLTWDQSPHLYSTSALSPFAVNGNVISPLPGIPATATTAAKIAPYAVPIDIGINRDTAAFQYRWTPDDAWDIKTDFSHMARTGTQVGSVSNGASISPMQFAKPVDDVTQNYGVSAEWVGTSPWGRRLVIKGGYNGSQYTDNYAAYTVQTLTGANGAVISDWPSNQANNGSATVAADLPLKSRYAGTLSYTAMAQNAAFTTAYTGTGAATTPYTGTPQASLDGGINTLLSNNIVTTKITSDLSSKLSYRYYDFANTSPELHFVTAPINIGGGSIASVNTLAMQYIKQNIGEELNWRPTKEWNLGAVYGFERYDWTRADVNVTNENSGKLFADWRPYSWITVRSSGYYAVRRYENYDYFSYVGNFQWPGAPNSETYASSYRQLMIDNRNTWKANFAVDVVVLRGLTLTPTLKYADENYGVDPTSQQGLQDSKKLSAGIDATYMVNPDTSFMVGYMYERSSQVLYGCGNSADEGVTCSQASLTNDTSTVHTFTTAVRYAAIPDKLDTELRYTASYGVDSMQLYANAGQMTGGQFLPDDTTWFQRLDATATYKFDHETVARMGWKGDVKAKLHYAWERNSATNWANDGLLPYSTVTGATSLLWLGWNNPNYNVHMLSASVVASW